MIQVSHMVEYLHETFYKHAFEYVEPVHPETNEKKQNQTAGLEPLTCKARLKRSGSRHRVDGQTYIQTDSQTNRQTEYQHFVIRIH